MKYTVLGPRLLVKVKKFDSSKEQKFAGSSLVMPDQMLDNETAFQTIGIVAQLGPTAKTAFDGFESLEVGHKVHFQRYGAIRLNDKDDVENEHWVVNAKDILVIEA